MLPATTLCTSSTNETRRFGRLLHYAGVLATVVCATAGYSLVHAPTIDAIADTSARIEELMLSVQNAPVIREQHRKVSREAPRSDDADRRSAAPSAARRRRGRVSEGSHAAGQRGATGDQGLSPREAGESKRLCRNASDAQRRRQLCQHLHVRRSAREAEAAVEGQGSDTIGWRRRRPSIR